MKENGFFLQGLGHLRVVLFVAFLALVFPSLNAQVASPTRPSVPPVLMDESGDRARQLDLKTLNIDVRITGGLSRTTMTMTFWNPGSSAVAGNLYFPLPPNATISGYALDINGVLVDGVPVDRDTGRQVYQTVMARGIDPGLVEWTRGNVFKTRVFPVPAQGSRTIRVSYLSMVSLAEKPEEPAQYILPLDYTKTVQDFTLSLEVVKPGVRPVVASGPWTKLDFLDWRDGFRTEFKGRNMIPNKDCIIELPQTAQNPVLVEKSSSLGSDAYFLWTNSRAMLQNEAGDTKTEVSPAHVTLYWDASFGRRDAAHQSVLKTLEIWFGLHAKYGKTKQTVDLVVFRETADVPRRYTIISGDARQFLADLSSIQYDGATRVEGLPKPDAASEMAIVVSDGFSTIGRTTFDEQKIPVYVLALKGRFDVGRLQAFAGKSGGQLIIVDEPSRAAAAIGKATFRVVSTKVTKGTVSGLEVVSDSASGLIGVTGRLESEQATVLLGFGYGAQIRKEVTLRLNKSEAADSRSAANSKGLLGTFWAQNRLATLVSDPDADQAGNKSAIRALGMEWGLVTPGTSLIVLETLEQYVEFNIPPPESLSEMRKEFFAQRSEKEKETKQELRDHLDRVFSLWQTRTKWWDTVFKYQPNYRNTEKKDAPPTAERELNLSAGADRSTMAPTATRNEISSDDQKSAEAPSAKPDSGAPEESSPSVSIQAWNPDTPYIRDLHALLGETWNAEPIPGAKIEARTLNAAQTEKAYQRYLQLRPQYEKSPGFFFDVGDFFQSRGARKQAIRIWSVLAEMDLEAPGLLRTLAYRLSQVKELELSKEVFTAVLAMRPEEPQSYRDLGLLLDQMKDHAGAVSFLWELVKKEWSSTPDIELMALVELNAAASRAKLAGQTLKADIDKRFIKNLDTDIRIVLTWDTNLSDMDLWVIEPSGEKAYYGNQNTHIGGLVSHDITTGYGPEEYLIRRAMKGTYTIQVNYYGNQNPEVSGTVTLQAEVITNFGRPNEKRQALTLSLKGTSDSYTVGEIVWK